MSYTVTQNTSFLTAASILQKIVSFFYFTILARSIGVENTGQYFFALTFTTIFIVVADFGLGNTLTREAAKFPDKSANYTGTVFWAKSIFGVVTYGLILVALELLHYPSSLKLLICLSGITMFFDNLQTVFYSLLRSRKNLLYEAFGMVGSQLLTLVIGGVALVNHWPVYTFIVAYTIPSFCNLTYGALVVLKTTRIRFWKGFDSVVLKEFLFLAWPIALSGIVGRLYAYSDSLLMSKMVSPTELGLWSVPYKMTFAFQFIPIAVAASLYPVISSLYFTDPQKIGELVVKAYRYLFSCIFPLVLGLGILARPVMLTFYRPSYLPAVEVLQILLAGLVFIFLTLINGAVLNAVNRQKRQTSILTIALALNIGLNLVLLPYWGIRGAALAALVSNFILWILGFISISKVVPLPLRELFKYFNQTFWAAVAMGILVFFLSGYIHWIFTILVGVLSYGVFLFWTGGLTAEMFVVFKRKLISR